MVKIKYGRFLKILHVTIIVAFLLAAIQISNAFGGTPKKNPDGTIYWPCQGAFDVKSSFYQAHLTASDIDGDGKDEILVGNLNGWLYCFDPYAQIKWTYYCGAEIQGAPACYDVDGDGKQEVFVGDFAGRMWGFNCYGQPLSQWGWPKQAQSGVNDPNAALGIFSSPAIGDINGDGIADIVYGSWGSYIYAYSYTGSLLPGWPFNNRDSIWSSPALADIDMDGLKEVVIGADVTGGPDWPYPRGGLLYALNADLTHVHGFPKSTPEVTWSSPACADIDGDGMYEIVVGTGHYWKAVGQITTEGYRVYAYNHDGSPVAGWPVITAGSTFSSPAIGDIDGDGKKEVAIACNAAAGSGDEHIMVIKPDGSFLWDKRPWGGPLLASPALADIDGDGLADVIMGSAQQMAAWNWKGEVLWNQTLDNLIITSPVAGDFDRDGYIEVAVGTGGSSGGGTFYVFECGKASSNKEKTEPWPMFRRNPAHHATWVTGNEPPPPPPRTNFNEYILLMNPSSEKANVNIRLMNESGDVRNVPVEVNPNSRYTVWVNRFMSGCGLSARVTSDVPICAERAMYFNFSNRWKGGHDSIGVVMPSNQWYLAEGCTSEQFDTFVLVQNPSEVSANVRMTFMREGLGPVERSFKIPPESRFTVNLKNIPGCENASISTKVDSDVGVIAERSMYFDYRGCVGGHDSVGVPSPKQKWYLAEGYTAESFDTYVLVQNPQDSSANVTLRFLRNDGHVYGLSLTVPPESRKTVKVDDIPGFEAAQVSTEVSSDQGIIAERAMYFNASGRDGGHDSIGTSEPSSTWYLPEGYTGGSFDTFVLIMNPSNKSCDVKTTLMRADGHTWSRTDKMLPNSRFTIHLDEMPGFSDAEVSTKVEALSGSGIIAERSMYFVYNDAYPGGHDSIGLKEASTTWYFAEGYTGN